ncbi:MAG: Rrf2 family transcriptional regulator [Bacillota bacterium]
MLISTKGRYALRVLIDLAEQPQDAFIPLKEIATRQEISEKYLEAILRILVKGNVLIGVRGKGGGYRFVDSPEACDVGRVLSLTEESLAPVACLDREVNLCERQEDCRTLELWSGLHDVIQNYLSGVSIADLVQSEAQGNV